MTKKNSINDQCNGKMTIFKSISSIDDYNYAIEKGIIDIDDVQTQIEMHKNKDLLERHPYKIYQTKDGRWHTYVYDDTKKNNRRQVSKSSKENLEKFIISYQLSISKSELEKKLTLEELYPEWLEFKAKHTNASTYITRIDVDWRSFYKDTEIVKIPISELEELYLEEWAHDLIKDNNMTSKKYYNATVIIRQIFKYAKKRKLIKYDPFAEVEINGKVMFRRVQKKPNNTQVFQREEKEAIEKMAWYEYENKIKQYELLPLAVMFQFQTGLRISELCVVRYSDIEGDEINIQRMLRHKTKEVVEHTKTEYGDRPVTLTESAKHLIATANKHQKELGVDSEGYIFSIDGNPLPQSPIEKAYRKYCRNLGTIQKSPNKTRKTYISALLDGNVNSNTVRGEVGHASEITTFGSYNFDRDTDAEKKRKIEKALNG